MNIIFIYNRHNDKTVAGKFRCKRFIGQPSGCGDCVANSNIDFMISTLM